MLVFLCLLDLVRSSYAIHEAAKTSLMRKEQALEGASEIQRLEDEVGTLADGCQHVFLDVGSNRGVHIRSLFEPAKYQDLKAGYWAVAAQQSNAFKFFLDFVGGQSTDKSVCAFGFEANPDFAPRLSALEQAYQKHGWNTKIYSPLAVSNGTGEVSFWREPAGPQLSGEMQKTSPFPGRSIEEHVQAADMMQFLHEHVLHRALPNASAPGSVVMKMDIEGSEFVVLPHLLKNGALCKGTGIDAITIEWHGDDKKFNQVGAGPNAAALTKQIQSQGNGCLPTDLLDVNDELGCLDELPLPNGERLPAVAHQVVTP